MHGTVVSEDLDVVFLGSDGGDEGGVDGHVCEELANLGGQRLLLGEETS